MIIFVVFQLNDFYYYFWILDQWSFKLIAVETWYIIKILLFSINYNWLVWVHWGEAASEVNGLHLHFCWSEPSAAGVWGHSPGRQRIFESGATWNSFTTYKITDFSLMNFIICLMNFIIFGNQIIIIWLLKVANGYYSLIVK